MGNPAPQAHQVRIRELATGRVFLAWPVDAREMLFHPKGGFEIASDDVPMGDGARVTRLDGQPLERGADGLIAGEPLTLSDEQRALVPPLEAADPSAPNVLVTVDASKASSVAEQLDAWTLEDLQTLAGRVDIDPTGKTRAQLVDLLSLDLPELVSAGVVSLEQLPELKITPEQFPVAAPKE